MNNKTDKLSAEEARAYFNKSKKPGPIKVKAEKKVLGAKAEMDIEQTPEQLALGAITINRNGEYVSYSEAEGYIEFRQGGKTWRVKATEVKP